MFPYQVVTGAAATQNGLEFWLPARRVRVCRVRAALGEVVSGLPIMTGRERSSAKVVQFETFGRVQRIADRARLSPSQRLRVPAL